MQQLVQLLLWSRWPVLVVGLLLVWRYLRGRVVGEHPQCRRCGYDLFGLPNDHQRCPECGANLRGRQAVLIGRRKRRWRAGLIALALAAGALAGLWAGANAIQRHLDEVASRPGRLLQALRHGDVQAVAGLLQTEPRLATCRISDWTPLQVAVGSENTQVVQMLLDAGARADVDVAAYASDPPLHVAVDHESTEIVRMLLAAGADLKVRSWRGNRLLQTAIMSWRNGPEMVGVLLAAGADPNLADDQGQTALHAAARSSPFASTATCKQLIAAGAKVDARDTSGRTPLHVAMERSTSPTVLVLLDAGAEIAAKNHDGLTPTQYAANQHNDAYARWLWEDIIKHELQAGRRDELLWLLMKDPAVLRLGRGGDGTLLHRGLLEWDLATVSLLLDAGADPKARRKDGATPLHCAAEGSSIECVQALLAKGADPLARDNDGKTPLDRTDGVNKIAVLLKQAATRPATSQTRPGGG
jgi:cytohesin